MRRSHPHSSEQRDWEDPLDRYILRYPHDEFEELIDRVDWESGYYDDHPEDLEKDLLRRQCSAANCSTGTPVGHGSDPHDAPDRHDHLGEADQDDRLDDEAADADLIR